MKKTFKNTWFAVLATAIMTMSLLACSDDDGVYKIEFGEAQVAGTWNLTQIDTTTYDQGKSKVEASVRPENVKVTFSSPRYTVTRGTETLESGTYQMGTLRLFLSHGVEKDTLSVTNPDVTDGKVMKLQKRTSETGRINYTLNR